MNIAIEVTDLRKEFKGFTLEDATFSLPAGYIMGFVGKNGAGKTTTIRLMLNMLERNGGEVRIFGMDNIADELRIKQDIGVVFDELFFVATWRVAEVERALKGFYRRWSTEAFKKYIHRFDLQADKRVSDLSRGMKMKLMLAVALSHDAKLLILDEPTSGLDPVARDELLDILSEYISDGDRSILFSTHITSDLEKIADYITLIDGGKIIYTGTKDALLESFFIVKGGPDDLSEPLQQKIIGVTKNRTGFSGLLPASEKRNLSGELVLETPTIDEILVHVSKAGTHNE
jgi:ABC-2 type transport system ATP-binding protein